VETRHQRRSDQIDARKRFRAHSDHVGALGDDGEGSEWSSHVRAVIAGLRPDARKTAAIHALRAVEVDVSGWGDARKRGGCGEAFCVVSGGSTKVTASGGAAVAVDMDKKKTRR
jgi:hypothetical protein